MAGLRAVPELASFWQTTTFDSVDKFFSRRPAQVLNRHCGVFRSSRAYSLWNDSFGFLALFSFVLPKVRKTKFLSPA
jgi:hypothetical protein